MPFTGTITSKRTGQNYPVTFQQPPDEADIDEAADFFDKQAAQQAGVDAAVLEQKPLGTFANEVRNIGPQVLDQSVGGLAKLNEAAGRSPLAGLISPLGLANQATQMITGFNPLAKVAETTDVIRQEGERLRPVNPFNETARTVGGAVNQVGGMIATGGLATAAGMAPARAMSLVPSVMGFAAGAGQGVDTAREMGITSPTAQAGMGAGYGAVQAAMEKLGGIGGDVVGRFIQPKTFLGRAGLNTLSEAGEEVLTVPAEDALTVGAGQFVSDPSRPGFTRTGFKLPSLNPLNPDTLARMKQAAIGGAAGGVVFSGLELAAGRPLSPSPDELPTNQTPGAPAGAAASAPLGGMAATTDAPEGHAGDLTINEVADLTASADVSVTKGSGPTADQTAQMTSAPGAGSSPAAGSEGVGQPLSDVGQPLSGPRVVSTGKPNGAQVAAVIDFVEAADLEPLLLREVGDDQTRDRANNRASAEQITSIATAPDAQLLGDSPVSSMGAPVVDDVILAGNGRAEGLLQGYKGGGAGIARYRDEVVRQAAAQGRPDVAAMKQPVMIRRVTNYLRGDRRSFVTESNPKYSTLQETVAEAALLDAEVLGDMSGIEFTQSGQLTSSSLQQVATKLKAAQRGVNATTGGKPDVVEGTRRVQLASLAKLAKDNGVDVAELSGLLETDVGRRAVAEVSKAAPRLAALDADLGLGDVMLSALRSFSEGARAVSQGIFKNLTEWADNRGQELIRDELSPEAGQLLEIMIETVRTPTKLRELFETYLEDATNEQDQRNQAAGSNDIFGDARRNVAGKQILRRQMAAGNDTAPASPEASRGQGDGTLTPPADTAGIGQEMSDPFGAMMQGTESTRPRNRGETDKAQAADPLAELQAANLAGQANQDQGRMEPLMSPAANRLGRGLADLMPRPPSTANRPPPTVSLSSAYARAARGQSSAMIPLADVFAEARKDNPALTREQFAAQVRAEYEAGTLMLEGANSQAEAEAAGLRIDSTPVGSAVRMAVVPGLQSPAGSSNAGGMASDSGAAQANEPSPGGLSEAEAIFQRELAQLVKKRLNKDSNVPELLTAEEWRDVDSELTDAEIASKQQEGQQEYDGFKRQFEAEAEPYAMLEAAKFLAGKLGFVQTGTSNQSEATYWEIPGGSKRVRLAAHGVVNPVSGYQTITLDARDWLSVQTALDALIEAKSEISSAPVNPESSRAEGGTPGVASPAQIAADQARNESVLKELGLPTKAGTRVWGKKPVAAALRKIAADATQPATMRLMARLLSRMDLGNLLLRIEADGRLSYAGQYQPMGNGRGEIALNTRVLSRGLNAGQGDVRESLVHEVLHHVTYNVLRNPKTAAQKAAKAALESLRKRALSALAVQEQAGQFDYELGNLDEFISALFTRADFQTALAGIPVEQAPKSLGQRVRSMLDEIFRKLAELVTGKPVPEGSVIEASFANALRLIEEPGTGGGLRQGDLETGRLGDVPLQSPAADRGQRDPGKNYTEARWVPPNVADQEIPLRADALVQAEADAWLASMDTQTAVERFAQGVGPTSLDTAEVAAITLLERLTAQRDNSPSEVARMWAGVQMRRMGKVWKDGYLSGDPARAMRQRGVGTKRLLAIAPVLAAENALVDRGARVVKERFEGGEEGVTEKVKVIIKYVDRVTGEVLTGDLDSETLRPGDGEKIKALRAKHPNLAKMLNALRRKIAPGMSWADIFMDMPDAQKERQREIYRRLMLDERLQALTPEERVALTNELDKAWQRERQKVFKQELQKAGVLGEKAATDRKKVEKALPKLLRLLNLGMMNSEMFREAIAPEYGVKTMTADEGKRLRDLFNAAYKLPKGVRQNEALMKGLVALQRITGVSKVDMLNNFWVASVLSGPQTLFDTLTTAASGGLFDTFTSALGLAMKGNPQAGITALAEWWRTLPQAMREAGRILGKGELFYLRQFADESKRGLEGLGIASAVSGERLLSEPELSKKALGFLLAWTGRSMAAFDHLTNTTTKAAHLAVARALYPDLYQGTLAPSAADRLHARTQAMAEITGGAEPVGNDQITRVNRRAREILEEGVNPDVVKEAEEMGDLAAFQNDPKGFMGGVYQFVKWAFSKAESQLEATAEHEKMPRQARAAMLFIAGSLRAGMGAKFIRFAANWSNKQLMAVPGTYLFKPFGFFGMDLTRTQANYIAGRQVVGLMVMTTLLTYLRGILDKDDDEEGWHLSGNWDDVPKNTQKELMSAGIPRLALWKREGGKITAFTYKNQPLSAMLAALGSLGDEKRYLPEQFKQHGEGGHLLRALAIGAVQIKDLSAVSGLADLLGKSNPNAPDQAEGFAERLNRSVARWGTGFIPNVIKDADAWTDTRFYKPETAAEEWVRGVPIMRRNVAGGRPLLNILGEPVDLKRAPWNRSVQSVETSEAQRVLGALLTRGLSLPLPSDGVTVTRHGKRVALDTLGSEVVYRYQKTVGEGYQEWLAKDGAALLTMPVEQAEAIIRRRSDRIRQAALVKVAY